MHCLGHLLARGFLQQLALQAGDFLGIVFAGQRAQLDAQLAEIVPGGFQRVVGGLENRVHDLLRAIQQLRVVVGQLARAVQQLLRAVVQLLARVDDLIRLFGQFAVVHIDVQRKPYAIDRNRIHLKIRRVGGNQDGLLGVRQHDIAQLHHPSAGAQPGEGRLLSEAPAAQQPARGHSGGGGGAISLISASGAPRRAFRRTKNRPARARRIDLKNGEIFLNRGVYYLLAGGITAAV